jgi:hypothetical protein
VLAVNLARRYLTKGQRAMIAARARLETKQSVRETAVVTGLNAGRIGQAAVVLEHAGHLVDGVIAGAVPLDKAYEEAKQRRAEQASREELAAAPDDSGRSIARRFGVDSGGEIRHLGQGQVTAPESLTADEQDAIAEVVARRRPEVIARTAARGAGGGLPGRRGAPR